MAFACPISPEVHFSIAVESVCVYVVPFDSVVSLV